MTRKQDSAKVRITAEELKQVLAEDRDLLKTIVEEVLQQVLEAEMEEALQAGKGERHIKSTGLPVGLLQPNAGDASGEDRLAGAPRPTRPLSHGSI